MIKKGIYFIATLWMISSYAMEQNWENRFEGAWGKAIRIESVIQQLVSQTNELNFTFNQGRATPLTAAVLHKSKEGSRLLLDKGADINMQTSQGLAPLHFAVMAFDTPMVSFLLERGANPAIKSNAGLTPLTIAKTNSYHAIAEILSKAQEQQVQKESVPSTVKPALASTLLVIENKTNDEYVVFDPLTKKRTVVEPQGSFSLPFTFRSHNKTSLRSTVEIYNVRDYHNVETAIKYRRPALLLAVTAQRDLWNPQRLKVSSVVEHKLEPAPKGVINRDNRTIEKKNEELGFTVELTLRGTELERSTAQIALADISAAVK